MIFTMFTKDDKKWLLENFASKDDLNTFSKQVYKRFDKLDKKFTDLLDFLDKDVVSTKKRLKVVEEHLDITPDLTN